MKVILSLFVGSLLVIVLSESAQATAALADPLTSDPAVADGSFAAAAAREQASLTAMRDALVKQVASTERELRAEHDVFRKKTADLEREAIRLTVEIDEAQAQFEELEKKNRAALAGSQIEVTVSDLAKAIDAFEGKAGTLVKVADAMRTFELQIERGLKALDRSQQVRVTAGSFFDAGGVERQGSITSLGESAAWGRWVDRSGDLTVPATHDVALGPNGKGGWVEIARDEAGALQKLASSATGLLDAVVFSEVKSRVDHAVAAGFADRAAGFVPLFWIGLLGLVVTGLFVAIARA